MKKFNTFMREAKEKGAVFTFGRFNPPTTGHEKLVKKLNSQKSFGDVLLFSSHSNDKVKNPLSHKDKVKYLKAFFGRQVNVVDADVKQIFQILTFLHDKKYTKIRMVVGSDRVKEFENIIKKYNSVKGRHGFYNFNEIQIVSAGERDPDADDVSGMSASKMREFAEKGDFESFKEGVPSTGRRLADKLYKDIRKGMGINEGTLPHYMVEDLIQEGVYDPGIFKAVFFSGGPGSGKSTVVDKLSLRALGLKLVNTDKAFENGLKKAGMTLDLRGADFTKVDPIRARAKKITNMTMDAYIGNRLGMIFDTTSANLSKVSAYRKNLESLGYECKMIYVNASLQNALARNNMRPRKLPHNIVQGDWEKAQKNMSDLKKIFGRDFVEVKNDDDLKTLETKATKLFSKLMTWTTKFPSNKPALKWREQELQYKSLRNTSLKEHK
jgi:predicted kinase/nicotinamide mononucleotide adenylyltransferase